MSLRAVGETSGNAGARAQVTFYNGKPINVGKLVVEDRWGSRSSQPLVEHVTGGTAFLTGALIITGVNPGTQLGRRD